MPVAPSARLVTDEPRLDVLRVVSAAFSRGLNAKRSPLHIDALQSPALVSWRLVGTELQKPYGWLRVGSNTLTATSPADVAALRLFYFINGEGVANWVAFSSQRAYYFNAGANTWDQISGGADIFTGTDTDPFDAVVAAHAGSALGALTSARNFLCVANGIDAPRAWDGLAANNFTVITNAPISRYLAYFADRLIAAYTTEGGTVRSTRIRWGASGDLLTWTGLGAGAVDRPTSGDFLTNIKPIRGACALYFNNAIETIEQTGDVQAPLAFRPQPGPGIGLIAPHSLRAMPTGEHIFLGTDFNVYRNDGNSPVAVGDDVRDEIAARINKGRLRNVIAAISPVDGEYLLAIPTLDDATFPSSIYVYNWLTGAWHRDDQPCTTIALGADTGVGETWTTVPGTWATLSGSWADLAVTAGATPRLFIGFSDFTVHKDDRTTVTFILNGTTLGKTSYVDTPVTDFGEPGRLKTLTRVKIRYRALTALAGVSFTISTSTDGGASFAATGATPLLSVVPDSAIREASADIFATGPTHRVRLQVNDPLANVAIVEVELHATLGGLSVF